jgi:hypothetical protein
LVLIKQEVLDHKVQLDQQVLPVQLAQQVLQDLLVQQVRKAQQVRLDLRLL